MALELPWKSCPLLLCYVMFLGYKYHCAEAASVGVSRASLVPALLPLYQGMRRDIAGSLLPLLLRSLSSPQDLFLLS